MKMRLFWIAALSVALAGAGLWLYRVYQPSGETIEIAAVGPGGGIHAPMRKSFRQGMQMCIDQFNAKGGINGRKVELVLYDDQNEAKLAQERAKAIVDRNRALAVIGHQFSSCSIAGGKVYREYGIPAITPFSTNVAVTQGNPWYFRIIYNDDLQGRFLANYAKNVLGHDRASIIKENHEYGRYLADTFERMAGTIGLEVAHQWEFDREALDLDQQLLGIVSQLQSAKDPGIVFLAVHAAEGVKLVRLMRDMFVSHPIIAPDSLASRSFAQGFAGLPKERITPGYYSSGVYVTSPLIFDTAEEKGLHFKEDYRSQFGEEADWPAAFAYDCMKLLLSAAEETGVSGQPATLSGDRQRIRDYLASMDEPARAMRGVTGLSYFDQNGDSQKPITIGVYKRDNIISALIQFQPIQGLWDIPDLEQAFAEKRILVFEGRHMYKTNVVYTGVKIHKISQVDFKNTSCHLDFSLWFRYQDELDVSKIEFLNALEPIELGEPVETETDGRRRFRMYRVKGRFQTDYMGSQEALAQRTLGVRFRHERLARKNLIYVPDILGMGENKAILRKMRSQGVEAGVPGWRIDWVRAFQYVGDRERLGRLRYIDRHQAALEYSGFNYEILLKKKSLILQALNLIPYRFIRLVLLISVGLLILSAIPRGKRALIPVGGQKLSKAIWLLRAFSSLVLLVAVEAMVVKQMAEQLPGMFMRILLTCFEILWWLVPAILLKMALEPFVWKPMEARSQRPVPNVLRRFVAYIIYFLALYGIVVFVLEQNITKLIATSGAIAALIGFVIKSNISNFFSGIIVNQGNAVRMGDWVKIDGYEEGRVTDITWRSTKIQNRDGNILSIPNSTVSEAVIYNYNFPQQQTQLSITVHMDPAHSPDRIKKVLYDSVISAEGVLSYPEPEVHFLGFSDWAADYVAEFYVFDYDQKARWYEAVWERIWTNLSLAGISPALRDVELRQDGEKPPYPVRLKREKRKSTEPLEVLNELDIAEALSDEIKGYLSEHMQSRHFKPEEVIVKQGETGDSLFIIAEGVVRVQFQIAADADPVEIVRMGAGSFFGEMALLTGEPRTATIIAVTSTHLFEIGKADIAPLLEKEPEVYAFLEQVLQERRAELNQSMQMAIQTPPQNEDEDLIDRIRQYFRSTSKDKKIKHIY